MAGGNFLGFNLPFGMSDRSNPVNGPANPQNNQQNNQPNNPNFPSNKQLDPKNPGADPNNQQQNNNNQQDPTNANNPSNNADPTKGQGSQLDSFKDLFKLPVDDKGNPVQQQDPMAGPLLAVDPAKLRDAASKLNFANGLAPETLQKAMSGQDPQAFMDVLNTVAQNGFLAAMQANAGVVETAFSRHSQRIDAALPERIRQTQLRNTSPKNPVLSHPAAAPMIESLKFSIAATNPTLSPDRVTEMAENYVSAMVNDMNSHNQRNDPVNRKKEADAAGPDWLALLDPNAGSGH
jgi:hypothetical protein